VEGYIQTAFGKLVDRYRLYEILKVERGYGEVRLTLANLWRLTRVEGRRSLILHTFDLRQGQWREQDQEAISWRECIEGGDFGTNWAETAWPVIEKKCKKKHGMAALFKNLLVALLEKVLFSIRGSKEAATAFGGLFDFTSNQSRWERWATYVFRQIVQVPSKHPAKVIRSALRRHIWDPELLSFLFPLRSHHDGRIPMSLYLAAQAHKDDLARICQETPNLLPLLNFIPPKNWSRPDLWQDRVIRASAPVFRWMSPKALRWLRRAPVETVGCFHHFFMKHSSEKDLLPTAGELADIMAGLPAKVTKQPKLAEKLTETLIEHIWDFLLKFSQGASKKKPEAAARLAHLLARHIMAAWPSTGWDRAAWKQAKLTWSSKENYGVVSIIDWFRAEGQRRGLPDKNSTWQSLKRRSDQWHEEIWRRGREATRQGVEEEKNATWESLLGPLEIGGVKIKPLVSGLDLYNESLEMRHCVSSYIQKCLKEGDRIFSLTEPNGKRSTLGLKQLDSGDFRILQHTGPANSQVSPAADKAAREICRLYTLKYWESSVNAALSSSDAA
jgi:hypothetical protein